jgi:hypothetical protein
MFKHKCISKEVSITDPPEFDCTPSIELLTVKCTGQRLLYSRLGTFYFTLMLIDMDMLIMLILCNANHATCHAKRLKNIETPRTIQE